MEGFIVLKTFSPGGVHPEEHKLTANKPVQTIAPPEIVYVPIAQHIGTPGEAVVKKGDKVKVGELIARTSGFVSANVHSPVSGVVEKIDNVIDHSGFKRASIIIKTAGDEWHDSIDRSQGLNTDISATPAEIIKRVGEAGIVGLGGATFPTHVKLSPPQGKKCEILIINGAECEPYLTSDHRLMIEKGDALLVGTRILMKALGAANAIIGVENNKPDAIRHLQKLTSEYSNVRVQPVKVKYPQGGEKQLIQACTGRRVPPGKLPVEVGVVVHNVGTAYAVYEAVQKNKPLVERVVTVTGHALSNPGNFLARIGTPVSTLVEAAGGLPPGTGKIVCGGPMMGKAITSIDVPVTKGTSGVLILPTKVASRGPVLNCIRCSKCVFACPMGLSPYLLMTLAEKFIWDRAKEERIMDCIECGSCSYTCPSARPLLDYIRLGKTKVGQISRGIPK